MINLTTAMEERSRIYGFLSIACPVITLATVRILQTRANAGFWEEVRLSNDGSQHLDGMIMFLFEIGEALFYTGLACVVGLLLAIRSIQIRGELTTLGYLCFSVNGAPLAIAALLWILFIL